MFYDYSRGWGTWVQGEITGEYLLFNSNQVNHMVHLAAFPTDEINLYVDWTLNDNVWLGALYGAALPGDAAEEAFGDDEPFHLLSIYAVLTF